MTGASKRQPYRVSIIQSTGYGEMQYEAIVSSERAARGFVRYFRDRVEHVIAEPVEVHTRSKTAIDEVMEQFGWLDRPMISEEFREQRIEDENSPFWGKDSPQGQGIIR